VVAHEGAPLETEWSLVERPELRVKVCSEAPLPAAQQRAIEATYLREQLGRLGNTPYELAELHVDLGGSPFAPSSLLNTLRRQAVEQLIAAQGRPVQVTVYDPLPTLETTLAHLSRATSSDRPDTPQLHLLVRTPEQLEAALELRLASITLDYLELYGLRP